VFPESTRQLFLLDYPSCRSASTSESEEQSSDLLRFGFLIAVANILCCGQPGRSTVWADADFTLLFIFFAFLMSFLAEVQAGF